MQYKSLTVTRIGNGYLVEPELDYDDRPEGWRAPKFTIQDDAEGEAEPLGALILQLLLCDVEEK